MKLLKFYADWCGPCKSQTAIIKAAGDKIKVPVEEVNIDNAVFMSAQYAIKSVPTLILLDGDEKEVKRHVGVMREQELIDWIGE